ncbi:unnamed protein product [Ilex paraguariensis]|uniref:Uncharacterized protein n=1 Tax=Ilex paraguariensis TaxID=185542 RepID=A0ABC8UCB2_9AQUA
MSPVLTSQGAVLATAVAVSGTVILLAFRLQKSSSPTTQFSINLIPRSPSSVPRSCISSDGKKREKKKKRVHFAEDVVDPTGNGEAYRKLHSNIHHSQTSPENSSALKNGAGVQRGMPANRAALYNGILRDRVLHRVAYSH